MAPRLGGERPRLWLVTWAQTLIGKKSVGWEGGGGRGGGRVF